MKLEVKNITKSFGEKQVLNNIDFSIESGKALGLLGRNGAGKTTTIRIIMGVFNPDSGSILLDGEKLNTQKVQTGYLPEERGLYPKKTVLEQMVYLAQLRGVSKKTAITNAKNWLTKLEVDQYMNNKLETLSKGNQQKVQLASTLVCDPKIVVLDEPFSGLDPVNSRILQDIVKELISMNKIVIFSSHQMNYIEEFCEDIAIIKDGKIVLKGNLNDIKIERGKNQVLISDRELTKSGLKSVIEEKLNNKCNITGQSKDELILSLNKDVSREEFLTAAIKEGIKIGTFETYKVSLNDIFIAEVGGEN